MMTAGLVSRTPLMFEPPCLFCDAIGSPLPPRYYRTLLTRASSRDPPQLDSSPANWMEPESPHCFLADAIVVLLLFSSCWNSRNINHVRRSLSYVKRQRAVIEISPRNEKEPSEMGVATSNKVECGVHAESEAAICQRLCDRELEVKPRKQWLLIHSPFSLYSLIDLIDIYCLFFCFRPRIFPRKQIGWRKCLLFIWSPVSRFVVVVPIDSARLLLWERRPHYQLGDVGKEDFTQTGRRRTLGHIIAITF